MARDLLDDSSSDSDVASVAEASDLKVNQEFAKRFEHNKKREELQKLEEKHGKTSKKRKRDNEDETNSESEDSSDSEDEDDEGQLATVALDSEIMATLNAIRSKDPRVYDGKTSFYTAVEENGQSQKQDVEKPMYLRDYHRENLLGGVQINEDEPPMTYAQEQAQLKRSIISEMHAAADESDEEDLLVAKKRDKPAQNTDTVALDVDNAERYPETFLSNFMAARAWIPTEKSTWQPLESDDEEEERRAEAYEHAYNMRFEDPEESNLTLRTYGRDTVAKYSVRREEKTRKKTRDAAKEQKELEKQQRKEEKARLRKLRVEEVDKKVQKIKKAAGLKSNDIRPEDWARFVDDDWDDAKWEKEMQERFGENYYAEDDVESEDDEANEKKKKPKKPKFDDDIDINDIVPDFKEDEAEFSLSEDDKPSGKKDHKKLKEEKKRESKKERRIIEQLVDEQLQLELNNSLPGKSTGFKYRETSPQAFGLSSRDILLADDSQLNQFAGLKKLASFRDPEKKRKDKKHLGKKARLRQWRKDTFGNEEGLQESELVPNEDQAMNNYNEDGDAIDVKVAGKSKRRRRGKKQKTADQVNE